jgi:hypothetical protein
MPTASVEMPASSTAMLMTAAILTYRFVLWMSIVSAPDFVCNHSTHIGSVAGSAMRARPVIPVRDPHLPGMRTLLRSLLIAINPYPLLKDWDEKKPGARPGSK